MPVPTLMCFNPRPHTRGDSPHGLPLWLCSVSIHAPTRGATECKWRCVECECVSIHAPARGATCVLHKPCKSSVFQSTPPRGGRHTQFNRDTIKASFNPRPRAGGDLVSTASKLNAWRKFQSTPPRGGRQLDRVRPERNRKFQSTPPRGGRHHG